MVLITLVFIFVWQPRLSVYLVQEALAVLLSIAALLILLLLPMIAFLLLWHGVRFVLLRIKRTFDLIPQRTRPPARPARPMSQPLPGH
jgi:membrane protease YdiL (CAAX protease family)